MTSLSSLATSAGLVMEAIDETSKETDEVVLSAVSEDIYTTDSQSPLPQVSRDGTGARSY